MTEDWRLDAACLGMDTELFFPTDGEKATEAKAVCESCPVRDECGDYAIDNGELYGVWGGMTSRQLRTRRGRRPRPWTCVRCGKRALRQVGEAPRLYCAECRQAARNGSNRAYYLRATS